MKNLIYFIRLVCAALPLLYGCADYVEGITPDVPEVVKPEDPGLKLQSSLLMFDASGMAMGIDLRSVGSGWQVEPGEDCPWLEKIIPEEGDAGNNIISISLAVNNGLAERSTFVVVKHLGTGDTVHVAVRQYTHESKYSRQTDSIALIALYQALSSKDNVWRNPWNEKKPITTWNGLTFEEIRGEQRVVGINVMEYSLSGDLPTEVGNLRELKKISIRGGSIGGRIPNSITSLRKLEEIAIPFKDYATWFVPESVDNMQSLKILNIGDLTIDITSFSRLYRVVSLEEITMGSFGGDLPEGISAWVNLKSLKLDNTRVTLLPEDFGSLSKLTKLSLYGCGKLVKLCDNLGALSRLEELSLMNCTKLEALPESIGELQALKVLKMNGCATLQVIPESFTTLTQFTALDFSNCSALKTLPATIGNMTQVGSINLSSCSSLATLPEGFGNLVKLTKLELRSCSALTTLPESIGRLKLVTEINMSGCEGLNSLPESIGDLANLKKIELNCKGPVALPSSFGRLGKLEEAIFMKYDEGPGITGDLSLLTSCTALKKLDASKNSLSGELSALSGLTNLTVIKLDGNKPNGPLNLATLLTDKITEIGLSDCGLSGTLAGLTEGTALVRLNLSKNKISGMLPEDIEKCSKITNLDVSDNEITGNIPVGMIKLPITYSGLMLKNNHMTGVIDSQITTSTGWKSKWYPATNILPQKEGYGFD